MIRRRRRGASGGVTIDPRTARRQEPLLVLGELEARLGRPRFGQLEPAAGEQEAGVGPGGEPVVRGRFDPPAGQQVVACLVDPVLEARPFAEQRLVGDLDRRCPGGRIAVEREQPVAAVLAQHHVELVGVDTGMLQLGAAHPAAGVLVLLVHADEPEEHLARRRPGAVVELGVDRFGAPPDGAGQTARFLVGGEGDRVGRPLGEQLGHLVLDERERARGAARPRR